MNRKCLWRKAAGLHAGIGTSRCSTTKTFTSEHFIPDSTELKNVITSLNSDTRVANNGSLTIKVCRLCSKGNKDDMGNLWKLTIRNDGSHHCFRCSQGGSWIDLKRKLYGSSSNNLIAAKDALDLVEFDSARKTALFGAKKETLPVVIPKTSDLFVNKKGSKEESDALKILEFLNQVRGISNITLLRYGVGMAVEKFMSDGGAWEEQLCVTFPWMNAKLKDELSLTTEEVPMKIVRIKYRALKTKGLQRILPKGGEWGFFGWHTVRSHHKEIIITEGEYDAMAVAQGLGIPEELGAKSTKRKTARKSTKKNTDETVAAAKALSGSHRREVAEESVHQVHREEEPFSWELPAISLPNGCNSLPVELIPLLERFTRIYLWLDNDKSGQESATKFARKLGVQRCYIVKPSGNMQNPPKDANDALRQDPQLIKEMLRDADVLSHDRIETFPDYRNLVLAAIMKKDLTDGGTPTPSMPSLVRICKGFRGGELVIFTGPTGAGKTTLLSQLSLDFAKAGVPTLWASFEILNGKLMEKMLRQSYRKGDLSLLSSTALGAVADDFATLPLHFLNFYGSSDLEQIIEAMEYAVYREDVKHIILDNLQFMLPHNAGAGSFDKFNVQDMTIERFRRFATEKMVNIILVVHPRKEEETAHLNLASVFGSAKATQEADLVLILQGRNGPYTSLDVKKNRFDGTLGRVYLQYSPPLHCFMEADEKDAVKEPPSVPPKKTRKK